ncbi:MAG: hypothetical protein CME65_11610 [Halobacteriovoraceae bacterium]|nr:hypothetical protein [Halobacteriovoraceae bacterium]|tara:strand:+ start:19492 stop:19815 length:324 start_codon:yes stop_codon:yes gene_type:complete
MSWSEIRETVGWVKNVPQTTSFKLRHIIQYAPQSFILAKALEDLYPRTIRRSVISIIFYTSIGAITELIQYFTPTRIDSLYDVGWNFIGATLGVALYAFTVSKGTNE